MSEAAVLSQWVALGLVALVMIILVVVFARKGTAGKPDPEDKDHSDQGGKPLS